MTQLYFLGSCMCKWKRTKGRNQQTDLKTEFPYYNCLHEVTFIMSSFEYSNSNLVHQQNTIKQLFKDHSSKFTLLSFQHNFLKGKKFKIRSYQEFLHEIQEKIRNCSNSGKIRNNQENQEVLDRLDSKREKRHLQQVLKGKQELSLLVRLTLDSDTVWLLPLDM